MHRPVSRLGIALLLLLACVWAAWPVERAYLQSYAILRALEHKPIPLLCAGVALHDVRVRSVTVANDAGAGMPGYIYEPTDIERPRGIVLLPGVHRLGIAEPRLTVFATALAQSGFRVLTPQIAALRDYRITPAAVTDVRSSIAWFAAQQQAPVGVMGLSFAGGLALLADTDSATAAHVAWIFSVGGHASMSRVAEYYLTGHTAGPDGKPFALPPNDYGRLVLAYMYPGDFLPPQDASAILPVLRAHLYEDGPGEQLLLARLTPAQQQEWKSLLAFDTPSVRDRANAAVAKLGPQMDAVSPEDKVATLTTAVFLLHGEADNVVPSTELAWLARDLPAGTVRYALVSKAISHVSHKSMDNSGPVLYEEWKLLSMFAHVLAYAESAKA